MIDTTMDFEISGPGGNSSAPSTNIASTMETPFGSKVSASDPPGRHSDKEVSKPETPGKINSVFYDPQDASPARIDSTFEQVIDQISFDRK